MNGYRETEQGQAPEFAGENGLARYHCQCDNRGITVPATGLFSFLLQCLYGLIFKSDDFSVQNAGKREYSVQKEFFLQGKLALSNKMMSAFLKIWYPTILSFAPLYACVGCNLRATKVKPDGRSVVTGFRDGSPFLGNELDETNCYDRIGERKQRKDLPRTGSEAKNNNCQRLLDSERLKEQKQIPGERQFHFILPAVSRIFQKG